MRAITRLLAVLLSLSAFAETFPVASAPLIEPPDARSVPSLAAGRDGYLAAWTDHRAGEPQLLAARIAPNGDVLDPTGIPLGWTWAAPRVVWNGERYLVFLAGVDIYMTSVSEAPVSEDGSAGVLRRITNGALIDTSEFFDVATNGQRIVVVYAGDHPSYLMHPRPHAAVLSMDGELLADLLLDENRSDFMKPSVAVNDSGFTVAWNTADSLHALHAVRLDARGARIDAQPRVLGGGAATLHANASGFIADLGYESYPVSADLATYGAPAERPPGAIFDLRGMAAVIDEDYPTHISAETQRFIEVHPFNAQGRPGDGRLVVRATEDAYESFGDASAVQRGNDVLMAWTTNSYRSSRTRLLTALASADTLAPKGEPHPLTRSAASQRVPAIASGENEALVAWTQHDSLYASRIAPDGRQLDGAGILVSDGYTDGLPHVAYAHGRYAIAYTLLAGEGWELRVRFFSPTEGLAPETVRIPADRPRDVAIGAGGGSLILVWTDNEKVRATRIHPGGTFDPPVAVTDSSWAYDPVISWNGAHFLIAWVNAYLDFDWLFRLGISGRRITPDLAFADAQPRVLASFGKTKDHDEPALASNGKDWFLTWTHATNVYSGDYPDDERKQVRIVRVNAEGQSDSPFGTALTRGFGSELAWTGSRLVMTWKDDATGSPLFVARLTNDNAAVDATAQRVLDPVSLRYEDRQASIARWRENWVAVYPRLGDAATGFVPRVLATFDGRTKPKVRAIR